MVRAMSNRTARIIVTIGPATNSERHLRKMKAKGVDFVRANMSHSSLEDLEQLIGLSKKVGIPFIIRWPENIRAGTVSNEIVHAMDLYRTLAVLTGGEVPEDRVVDSIDQSAFFLGKQKQSNRDSFIVYVGNDMFGIKWRNWKMMFKEVERGTDNKKTYDFPRFFNLYSDPKEEYPLTKATAGHFWVRWPMGEVLTAHGASLKKEPPISPGTSDPYHPRKQE